LRGRLGAVSRACPGLDLILERWLHRTMQGIGIADEVSDALAEHCQVDD